MNRTRRSTYTRFLTIFCLLGVLGLGSATYVLVQQRVVLPFQDVYSVSADFAETNGVSGGQGQPVNVAGVKVGQVTGVRLVDGRARVTMQIQRDLLPHVYRNASASLEPITPLKDMEIALNPGTAAAPVLPRGEPISLDATSAPVPIEDLLSRLDLDTRSYLSGLLASLDRGTAGRGDDLRRALAALGPSTEQAHLLTASLDSRRAALARLVHNLAIVSKAASQDSRLDEVVAAGNRTLDALVTQDRPLRRALAKLPGTLDATSDGITHLTPFANALGPALTALTPAVHRLPATLRSLDAVARVGTPIVRTRVRPLARRAQQLVKPVGPAVTDITAATPALTGIAKTLNYTLNEAAYNPPGDDEGFLFWAAWAAHNLNSVLSTGDAHGTILRAITIVSCNGFQTNSSLKPLFKALGTCPG